LTGANPNVTLELGIAMADNHPYVVAIRKETVGQLNSDIHGWDQLRYETERELADTLLARIKDNRVPWRSATKSAPSLDAFQAIEFGLPMKDQQEPRLNLGFVIKPISRDSMPMRGLLGKQREVNRQVSEIVARVANEQKAGSYFDGTGFTPREYESYIEIFEAPSNDEGLRIYRDGTVVYYRSLRTLSTVML